MNPGESKIKKPAPEEAGISRVQAERLELTHLAALDPKSSVSTNSTTPAIPCPKGKRSANINQISNCPDNFRASLARVALASLGSHRFHALPIVPEVLGDVVGVTIRE